MVLAAGEIEAFQRAVNAVVDVIEKIDTSHEIEVLADCEVFVEPKLLSHVSGLALDGVAAGDQVMAETGAVAGIGREQPADQAQRRRLARTVGPEETADAPGHELEINLVHNGARAIALDQSFHVDCGLNSFIHGSGSTSMGRPGRSRGSIVSGRASTRYTSLERALCE